MTARLDMTIGEIVAADHRAAAVFDRYGLDFCCHGRRTVDEEARQAGVNASALLSELDDILSTPAGGVPRFQTWDAPALISYIVANHHEYVREAIPGVLAHTRK